MNLHFNHPDELTPEVKAACGMFADAGVPLGAQTVLLKGVNDDPDIMKRLMHQLLLARIKPYYLYQADLTKGTNHFRTTVETGLNIIKSLQGHTSGMAVPHFVIDAPGGGGKIPSCRRLHGTHGRRWSGASQLREQNLSLPAAESDYRPRAADGRRANLLLREPGRGIRIPR